jgi:Flp pilus assembly protein TadD
MSNPGNVTISQAVPPAEPAPRKLEETFTAESLEAFLFGEATLGQVLGVNVQEAYAIAELAFNLAQGGDLDRALALAEGLVLLNPRHAYFHSLLASIHIRRERFDDALRHLNVAIGLDPDEIASRVNRGEILLVRGELEAALVDFSRAIELDARGTDPMARRARVLVSLGAEILRRSIEGAEARQS